MTARPAGEGSGAPDDGVLAPDREPDPQALAALALRELEPLARARMAPAAWDYVASGAWDEVSLADNEASWRALRLLPRVLVDVATVDTSTTLLGAPAAGPWAIAPMAAASFESSDSKSVQSAKSS